MSYDDVTAVIIVKICLSQDVELYDWETWPFLQIPPKNLPIKIYIVINSNNNSFSDCKSL